MKEVKYATVIRPKDVYADGQHCDAREDGLVIDYPGQKFYCEACGRAYKIDSNADIE